MFIPARLTTGERVQVNISSIQYIKTRDEKTYIYTHLPAPLEVCETEEELLLDIHKEINKLIMSAKSLVVNWEN